MVSMKFDLSKKSLGKNPLGTDITIVQGIYDPVEMLSHRNKKNSISMLSGYNNHQQSKTIFDWKKHLMKKHEPPSFNNLSLDLSEIENSKRKNLKKNNMTNSMDIVALKKDDNKSQGFIYLPED